MSDDSYNPTERRPVAARELGVMQSLASRLSATGISANAISISGMLFAVISGLLLWSTGRVDEPHWLLWFAAAILMQLRLLANLFDGMVAVEQGSASALGELFNEAPDRVSDAVILIGLGYAAGGAVELGYLAALLAVFTAYVRALGSVAGADQHYCGPMAKQARMNVAAAAALWCAAYPLHGAGTTEVLGAFGIPALALTVIVIGCVLTVIRRFRKIAAQLNTSGEAV